MARQEPLTCIVVRVTRPDTLLIRCYCPQVQSMINTYLVLEGVTCEPEAKAEILDWCELHADAERLRLMTWDWFRDNYGRVLGDLADIQTGETLTQHLLDAKVAEPRPDHYLDILRSIAEAEGPDSC